MSNHKPETTAITSGRDGSQSLAPPIWTSTTWQSSGLEESRQHAEQFKEVLRKAEKRFAALAKVEERHANAYQAVLDAVNARQENKEAIAA